MNIKSSGTALLLIFSTVFVISSCAANKNGCPSSGANVGAEKILSGDPKAIKSIKRGKKFKMQKY